MKSIHFGPGISTSVLTHLAPWDAGEWTDRWLGIGPSPPLRLSAWDEAHVYTFCEVVILRARRRIAEGKLSPNTIRLVYHNKDNEEKVINIDAMGGIDFWPRGVFEEDLREVQAIRLAQKEREK
jgi:hypothetical protein